MSKTEEAVASQAFLQALLLRVDSEASREDIEYLIRTIFPVLIPGIVHLLKAHTATQLRLEEKDESALAIQPMDHLAKYLFRHNPHHCQPTAATTELQAWATKMLRK